MSQTPTIGRMVHYYLNSRDAELIEERRKETGTLGNHAKEGQVYPAVVTALFDVGAEVLLNLRVILDGDDLYWATSRHETTDESPGTWAWPARV